MEEQQINNLNNINVVVTGAGRGLGAALALALADLGCHVTLCARSHETLDVIAGHIETRTGRHSKKVLLDLADAASIEAASREIRRDVPIVDVLIHNGAMWLEHRQSP